MNCRDCLLVAIGTVTIIIITLFLLPCKDELIILKEETLLDDFKAMLAGSMSQPTEKKAYTEAFDKIFKYGKGSDSDKKDFRDKLMARKSTLTEPNLVNKFLKAHGLEGI